MKVQRFEDLRCWQAARSLVKEVYIACEEGKLIKDFDTKSQLRKAALSTMNNIAEGFGRFNRKDSIRFYDFSQSSAIEILSICYVLSDLTYLTPERIGSIREKAEAAKNLTLAFIKSINTKINSTSTLTP
jgi:four helix bundle protein